MDLQNKEAGEVTPKSAKDADVKRLRVLWMGLGLYFLIMLNAVRYASRVPYQILIIGSLINAAIIVAIVVAIRRVNKRLKK